MADRPLPIEPDSVFSGLRWAPIVRGAVLDNVLTLFASFPIMFYFGGAEAFAEDEETATQAVNQALAALGFLVCVFVVGLLITVYAAFWASRRAGLLHLRHGGWTAVTSAVLACVFLLLPGAAAGPALPLWYDVLGLAFMVPAGLFGGWLASDARSPAA
jgi:hypothetical protein